MCSLTTLRVLTSEIAAAVLSAAVATHFGSQPTFAQNVERQMTAPRAFVDYNIEGKRFHVPEKYLGGSQVIDRSGKLIEASWFDFTFWLSDGKPSPVRAISLTTFWPVEPGRPSVGETDFVVHVYRAQYVSPSKERELVFPSLPSQWLSSILTHRIALPQRKEDAIYGLSRYTLTVPGVHLIACATPGGSDPDVILESDWIERDWSGGRPPNPFWQTQIFSKRDGLLIGLRFPEIALSRCPTSCVEPSHCSGRGRSHRFNRASVA